MHGHRNLKHASIIAAALTHSVEQSSAEQKHLSVGQEIPRLYGTRKFITESFLLGPTLNNIKPLVTSLTVRHPSYHDITSLLSRLWSC
jgi:hypothetical protein